MSPFAVKAIQLLLSLSLLIVLHELGHFIPAKLFKTRVEKFYLFFDVKFSLFKKKIGENRLRNRLVTPRRLRENFRADR